MNRFRNGILAMLLTASPALGISSPGQLCRAAVELASGKYQQCRLTAESKFARTGDGSKRMTSFSKCEEKLSTALTRAVDRYGAANCTASTVTEYDSLLVQCSDVVATASGPGGRLPYCGNGVIDVAGEQCDGSDLGEETCERLTFAGGTLACDSNCRLDATGCIHPTPTPSPIPTPTPTPRIFADSVAGFSSTQGQAGWFYGNYTSPPDAGSFQQSSVFDAGPFVPPFDTGVWWITPVQSYSAIWASGQSPGGQPGSCGGVLAFGEWSVRRWVSPTAGTVSISGNIWLQTSGSDGAVAHILIDGAEKLLRPLDGSELTPVPYVVSATLNVGSTVDLVASPHLCETNDWVGFTATIEQVP